MEPGSDQSVYDKLGKLHTEIERLSREHESLGSAALQAQQLLQEMQERREKLVALNQRLAMVSAESAELLADLEQKNEALFKANAELAKANAHAAELMAEIEVKNSEISSLNGALSQSNALASELLAELELKKAELESANLELGSANREKSHLLGVVAHDLRSGLGGIHGFAQLLAIDLEDADEGILEQVKLIELESTRMLELLASLLDVSSLDQGRIELNMGEMDFNFMISEACAYHQAFAQRKEQVLSFVPDESLGCASLDPFRIRQACDNLISNAIKYSPANCSIRVSTWAEGDSVGFAVEDGGPGLSEKDFSSLFKPFQKLSAKPTAGEDSHGLGLAISKKLIELHNGRVWAENMPEGGARFAFTLPVSSA